MTTGSQDAAADLGGFGGEPEPVPAAGMVVEEDRGSLPYALIHGEALVAVAAWAVGEAGIDLVDLTVPWEVVADLGIPLVLHDPLCPMTPPDFLAACARAAVARNVVVAAVRPVTDTVKQIEGGRLGATVDREGLAVVCSPIVLPPHVVRDLTGLPTHDFAELVGWLRERYDVELLDAPPTARRVGSEEDLRVLQAFTDPR